MLLRTSQLVNIAVMSLQTGKEIASTSRVLIDPANLKIVAFELTGEALDETPSFLRIQDVRELSDIGFIVDSSEEFVGIDDVISLKNLYELEFDLNGLRVIDTQKQKLGKVEDSVFNTNSFMIEQLRVRRPLFKSLGDAELLISHKQIVEINDTSVIVKSPTIKAKQKTAKKASKQEFNNPFRKPHSAPQPEASSTNR